MRIKFRFGLVLMLAILCLSFFATNTYAQNLTGKYADKFFYESYGYPNSDIYSVSKTGVLKNLLFSTKNLVSQNEEVFAHNKIGYYVIQKGKSVIYYYDLMTKKNKRVKSVSGFLLQLAWLDKNTYAYLNETQVGSLEFRWTLYLRANGKTKKLKSWTGGPYGRGGYYEDSDILKFSSDGKKILHIDTDSVRNVSDFNVYILNRKGKIVNKIKNATQPTWISNDKVVYRKYQTGYLYKYNLKTKKSTKIKNTPVESFNPTYLADNNKIAFWVGIKKPFIYTYSLSSGKVKKIVKNAVYPTWLNSKKIVVNKAKTCDPYKAMCPNVEGSGLLNLTTKKIKTLSTGGYYFTQYK